MKAQSADYISIQNLYKSKARADIQTVLATVRSLEKQLGRATPIGEAEVEAFCKNAAHIKLIRGRPFHVPGEGAKIAWGDRAKSIANALTDDSSLVLLYIGFLAYDEFCAVHTAGKPPGLDDVEGDVVTLSGIAHKIIDDLVDEAGKKLEASEYDQVRERAAEICQEM
jgi:amyloid beta precursor protein binding protein 1